MKRQRPTGSIGRIFTSLMALTLSLLSCWALTAALQPGSVRVAHALDTIVYVDGNATGAATGITWTDAYTDLQDALTSAAPETEIWVADGVYYPTDGTGRAATFDLKNEVAIYGGFSGNETNRAERAWETNFTVLSGDIGVAGDHSDNSYHVVTASNTDHTAVLDGFTIREGNADGVEDSGGGLYNFFGDLTLANLTFSENRAGNHGGGMYSERGSPAMTTVSFIGNTAAKGGGMYVINSPIFTLTQATFLNNTVAQDGGGLYLNGSTMKAQSVGFIGNSATGNGGGFYSFFDSSPSMVNGLFSGNSANAGGGMYSHLGNAVLVNVTFSRNQAAYNGGGLLNSDSSPQITNAIFWENQDQGGTWATSQIYDTGSSATVVNYSLVQGWGGGGSGNINANPLFADPTGADGIAGTFDDDLRLLGVSPAIDAGDNTAVLPDYADLDGDGNLSEATPFDLLKSPRFIETLSIQNTGNGAPPLVDMGAMEAFEYSVSLPMILRQLLIP